MKLKQKRWLSIRELVLFSMFGALMFCSKLLMEALPNVHLLGMLTVTFTLVYRKKALFPIYVYVFLMGIYGGFSYWWIHHLYVWTILWGVTMLLPRKMTKALAVIVYCTVCLLHGLLYGVMCSPIEALVHGFDLRETLAWIAYGSYFDVLHGIGNTVAALLVLPLSELLIKLEKKSYVK